MSREKSPFRVTGPTLKVLSLFLERHPEPLSGADLINAKKLLSGTLYPILDRLSAVGILEGEWESGDPSALGRPLKKLYKLSGEGVLQASQIVQEYGVFVPARTTGWREKDA